MSPIKKARIEKYYSQFAFIFIGVVIFVVIAIIYFSLSKTVITIILKPTEAKTSFDLFIGPKTDEEQTDYLEGRLAQKTLSGQETVKNLSSLKTVEAKAGGVVTIYNKHTSAQPLVATTRLLSREGILFRTKKTISVPAGDQVDVEVEADEPGEKGNIGPSHFTIVALWKAMQEKVYGESTTSMTGGTKDVMVVTLESINEAKDQTAKKLKEQAIQELDREIIKANPNEKVIPEAVTYQILEEKSNVEPGAEVEEIKITSKIKIIAVIFEETKLFELAQKKLASSLSNDLELASFNQKQIKYTVKAFDLNANTATLEVTPSGKAYLKLGSPIFNRDNLTNRDKQEIQTYFSDFPEIENVDVKFSPFWVFRSPTLKDHIEIKIKK